MKKFILLFLCATALHGASAEINPKTINSNPPLNLMKLQRYSAMQNQWFVGVGGGVGVYFGDHDRQLEFGKRIAPKFDVYAGKWFNTSFGVRVGANGYQVKGLTQTPSLSTGKVYDASQNLERQAFTYVHVYSDLLFQWSNDIYQYNNKRIYNIMPFAGIGVMVAAGTHSLTRFSPSLGLLQTLRLTSDLAFTIDVRGNLVGDAFDGEKGGRNFEGAVGTTIGLNYKF